MLVGVAEFALPTASQHLFFWGVLLLADKNTVKYCKYYGLLVGEMESIYTCLPRLADLPPFAAITKNA